MLVYLPQSFYSHPEPYSRIQAVINYVNILFEGLYEIDELPAQALEVYYVDYYYQQVMDNGHLHFFINSHEDENLFDLIFRGLKGMKAAKYTEILKKACEALALEDESEMVETLAALDAEFEKLGSQLVQLNSNYVSKIENLAVVSDAEFNSNMQKLIDSVPDQAKRALLAQEEAAQLEQ